MAAVPPNRVQPVVWDVWWRGKYLVGLVGIGHRSGRRKPGSPANGLNCQIYERSRLRLGKAVGRLGALFSESQCLAVQRLRRLDVEQLQHGGGDIRDTGIHIHKRPA